MTVSTRVPSAPWRRKPVGGCTAHVGSSRSFVITVGYAVFQTANNTAGMTDIRPDRRGVTSGMLNLSRNLGLITGTSVMGAVFALASGTTDVTTAGSRAVATGMQVSFAVAGILIVVALAIAIAIGSRARSRRPTRP